MAAEFQEHKIPQLEEGELEGATASEAMEEIERLMQEENGRISEDAADFRYEREKTEEGFRYVPTLIPEYSTLKKDRKLMKKSLRLKQS
ncbi:MAG: hypothetical protein ABEJ95_01115 [Candidatus Nanohalobium sp.]